MITIAPGVADDFHDLNAFTAAAIKDAFYRPGLMPEQIAENDRIAASAERTAREVQARGTARSSSPRTAPPWPAS